MHDFTHFFEETYPRVVGLLMSLGIPRELAEDLAQETFKRFLEKYRGKPAAERLPLLFRCARNLLVDHLRRPGNQPHEADDALGDCEDPAAPGLADALASERRDRFLQVFCSLDPLYQRVLVLKYVTALSSKTIAEMLGKTEDAVNSLLARARDALRKRLGDAEDWLAEDPQQ